MEKMSEHREPPYLIDTEGNIYQNEGEGKGLLLSEEVMEFIRRETLPSAPERFKRVERVERVEKSRLRLQIEEDNKRIQKEQEENEDEDEDEFAEAYDSDDEESEESEEEDVKYDAGEPYYVNDLVKELVQASSFTSKEDAHHWVSKRALKCIRVINGAMKFVLAKEGPEKPYEIVPARKFLSDYGKYFVVYIVVYKDEKGREKIIECKHTLSKVIDDVRFFIRQVTCTPYHEGKPDPWEKNKDVINVFPGYQAKRVQEVNKEIVKPFLNHIYECWASRDKELFLYFVRWFAYGLQYPEKLPEVMPIIFGELSGEGKSIIILFFINYIYGLANSYIASSVDGLLRWPGVLHFKLFVWLDELVCVEKSARSFVSNYEKLKIFFTSPVIDLEKKHKDIVNERNYSRWIACTNNPNPIAMKAGIDRRVCFVKCSSVFKGNTEYFDQLAIQLFNQDVGNHVFTYLLDVKLDDFKVREFPFTEEYQRLKDESLPVTEKFMNGFKTGDVEWDDSILQYVEKENMYRFHTKDMYDYFKTWCKENYPGTSVPNVDRFSKTLKKYCIKPSIFSINKIRARGWYWEITPPFDSQEEDIESDF